MLHKICHFVLMLLLLTGLTACFSASVHFQFDEQGQVTIENGVILEKELVALAEAADEGEVFCSGEGERREEVQGGIACIFSGTTDIDNFLSQNTPIQFGSQMADDAFSSEDFDYEAMRLSDGSIMVRFDLGELHEMAGEQAAGGSTEGLSDDELRQIKEFAKAMFADSYITMRISAPQILSTNGQMVSDNSAEMKLLMADIIAGEEVPDAFIVNLRID